jgi:hypothetical protein
MDASPKAFAMTAPWDAEAAAREMLRASPWMLGEPIDEQWVAAILTAGRATARMDRQECATCDGDGNDPGNCDKDCPSCGGSGRATAPSGAEEMREAAAKVIREYGREQEKDRAAEKAELGKDYDMNCYGAGFSEGAITAARQLLFEIETLPASPPPALGDVTAEELEAVRRFITGYKYDIDNPTETNRLLRRFLSRIPAAEGKADA